MAALAVSGWLLRCGWDVEPVARFVRAEALAAGDEEWKARSETAASTQQRLVAGRPATEVTALAGLLRCGPLVGELVVAQIALWLGIASPGGEKAPYVPTSAFMPIPKKGREGHKRA
jgi:hypothetical protein